LSVKCQSIISWFNSSWQQTPRRRLRDDDDLAAKFKIYFSFYIANVWKWMENNRISLYYSHKSMFTACLATSSKTPLPPTRHVTNVIKRLNKEDNIVLICSCVEWWGFLVFKPL
jgi:hypothetical protein